MMDRSYELAAQFMGGGGGGSQFPTDPSQGGLWAGGGASQGGIQFPQPQSMPQPQMPNSFVPPAPDMNFEASGQPSRKKGLNRGGEGKSGSSRGGTPEFSTLPLQAPGMPGADRGAGLLNFMQTQEGHNALRAVVDQIITSRRGNTGMPFDPRRDIIQAMKGMYQQSLSNQQGM